MYEYQLAHAEKKFKELINFKWAGKLTLKRKMIDLEKKWGWPWIKVRLTLKKKWGWLWKKVRQTLTNYALEEESNMAYYQLLGKRTLVSPSLSPPSHILTTAGNLVYWCSPEHVIGQNKRRQVLVNPQRKWFEYHSNTVCNQKRAKAFWIVANKHDPAPSRNVDPRHHCHSCLPNSTPLHGLGPASSGEGGVPICSARLHLLVKKVQAGVVQGSFPSKKILKKNPKLLLRYQRRVPPHGCTTC